MLKNHASMICSFWVTGPFSIIAEQPTYLVSTIYHEPMIWYWWCLILIHMISIDEMFQLIQGQDHKVKGQGQSCNFV